MILFKELTGIKNFLHDGTYFPSLVNHADEDHPARKSY